MRLELGLPDGVYRYESLQNFIVLELAFCGETAVEADSGPLSVSVVADHPPPVVRFVA